MDKITHKLLAQKSKNSVKVSNNQSQLVETKNQPPLMQIPGDWFPHANFSGALWIKLDSRELTGMQTGTGPGGALKIGKKGPTFKFLAPLDIIESHAHEWEPYASIQSKVLEKIVSFSTGIDHGVQVVSNLITSFKNAKKMPSGKAWLNILTRDTNVSVPKFKIDTPLVYRNSQRRRMDFVFTLADAGDGSHLVDTVHTMMELAAPVSKSQYEIDFPYVFSISTEPQGLFQMQYAVITQISPTWKHPFINGNAVVCDLTVSVMDMSPLFRKTLEQGGIVNVVTKDAPPSVDKQLDKVSDKIKQQRGIVEPYKQTAEQKAIAKANLITPSALSR